MTTNLTLKLLPLLAAGFLAAGCTSNGDGTGGSTGGPNPGAITNASNGVPPNDGTAPTSVSNGGTLLTGNFICSSSVLAYGAATTVVGTSGLVGGSLTTLVNSLGGTTLTQLLNSVTNPERVIDGNLGTYASFNLTAGGLGVLTSVDESVVLPASQTVPAGKYAVFGVSFPSGTADVNLLNSVKVTTFRNGVAQDSNTLTQTALTLIAQSLVSSPAAGFIGVKSTQPYDTAQISVLPGVLSVSVGDAMRVHELCVDGSFR